MTREEVEKLLREATGMKYGLGKATDLILRIADEQWNAALDEAVNKALPFYKESQFAANIADNIRRLKREVPK